MSKLLEIFGRAITVNTADLIWHWLNAVKIKQDDRSDSRLNDLDEVIELLGEMELDKAQEKLRFYLFENPDCARGRMAAVAVCLHKNDLKEAVEQLQSVYLRQPSNTMALYTLGCCYEQLGHEAQAVEFYQDCLKFKNYLELPRQRMAAIYFKNGRVDKTIREYELLTIEHPEDICSLVSLGYLYNMNHQYEKAIDTFNMAIISHPDNFHDNSQDIEIERLTEAGLFDDAIERVQWLMDKVGEMPDLKLKMADILTRAGQAAEATAHYQNAIRNQPNYLEATIKLGTHHLRLGRIALAAEQFNRAVEINDEIVDAYIGLAVAQNLAGETETSYGTLSLASAIQQNSTLLFSETAKLNFQVTLSDQTQSQQMTEDSDDVINNVIEAHQAQIDCTPTNADIHHKYGILMMIVGNLNAAIQSFKNALDINPTHHRARSKLAICLYDSNRRDLAVTKLTEQEPLEPRTLQLHYKTAILYCNRYKFAQALSKLENAMKENFTEPEAIVNIEVVLENLGLVDRAMVTWDRLTEAAHHAISSRFQ